MSEEIKERPMLFNGDMVRAILEGRKSVTRRAIRHQPDVPVTDAIPRLNYPHGPATSDWYWRPQRGHLNGVPSHGWDFKCPYGQPGDRLLVIDEILLEITDVRIERLQVISRGDAMAEGCPFPNLNGAAVGRTDPICWFNDLWVSLYGTESWDANPWVWVVEFKRVTP